MKTALIFAGLEGVAGVNLLEWLVPGTDGYEQACLLLTSEIQAATRGFVNIGYDRVITANIRHGILPSLLEGIDVAACIGMCVAADVESFGALTMALHCDWWWGRRRLSETDVIMALLAEKGVPLAFVSGDAELGERVRKRAPFVVTKHSGGIDVSVSVPRERVLERLELAAQQAPVSLPVVRGKGVRIRFKSAWQAELTSSLGERVDECTLLIEGKTLGECYGRAYQASVRAAEPLGAVRRGDPGEPTFDIDTRSLMVRPFERMDVPGLGKRPSLALRAFIKATAGKTDWQVAERGLTLHMLETHASRFFRRHKLGRLLNATLRVMRKMNLELHEGLDALCAMARLDVIYVLQHRGDTVRIPSTTSLLACIEHVHANESEMAAWLMVQMARQLDVETGIVHPERMMRDISRLHDLYWLTHLYLLETRYLRRELPRERYMSMTEELLIAVPWLLEHSEVDVGAEVALCLQLAGEHRSLEHMALLDMVATHQEKDGRVVTPSQPGERWESHTTAAALLAFAGAMEKRSIKT